ncbi:protein transporter SEC9, partial [Lactarius hatsudake]
STGSMSDPYSSRSTPLGASTDSVRECYHRNNPVDAYSRGQGDSFTHDGPTLRELAPGEENEEDIEAIKQQTRFIKQDSLSSTRNTLRLAREAEETTRGTINRLGGQSEKLANTERHLDLNRSIFRPVITFNKDAKRAAQEAKASNYYGSRKEGIGAGPNGRRAAQQSLQKEQRMRYQFEATASYDELEDELDDNFDEISDVTQRLKALGAAMGKELDHQNNRIQY